MNEIEEKMARIINDAPATLSNEGLAKKLLKVETNGFTLKEMTEFFEKIDRKTQREAIVKKKPELPEPALGEDGEQCDTTCHLVEQKNMLAHNFVQEAEG